MSLYYIHYNERIKSTDKDGIQTGTRVCSARPYEFDGSALEAERSFIAANPGIGVDRIDEVSK